MPEAESFQPPRENKVGEIALATTKAGLNLDPTGIGGAAAELLELVVRPILGRRLEAWKQRVGDALDELIGKGVVTLEGLQENEQFATIVMQASQAAARNHQEEKLEALKNAVLSSATPCPVDETLQQMFVQYVDFFNVWHLRILELFADSVAWFERNNKPHPAMNVAISGSMKDVLLAAYPVLSGQDDFYNQLAKDLHSRGLFGHDDFGSMLSAGAMRNPRSTELGRKFLAFITKPSV